MYTKTCSSLCIAICGLASFVGVGVAHASTIGYITSGTGSDGALSAEADFTTGAGFVTVVLENTLGAQTIRSEGQALSDISFTLSNAPGTLGTTSATGQLGTLSSSNVVTYQAGSPTRWLGAGGQGSFGVSGNVVTLESIGGGQPTEMLAPNLANGGTYSNINNGFSNFDPYVIGPATFTIDLAGVTAATTITAVQFSFGTGPDTNLPGTPGTPTLFSVVPEPTSLILMGTGVICAARLIRRKTQRA
jgi:hypothetical protein